MIGMYFEFGDVRIKVPDDYVDVLTDLALIKGFDVAEKLIDAEAMLENGEPGVVDINHLEMLELARLLIEVVE